ncbi:hypothetical protein B0A48_15132 [Cryoendolithus antarcticus]|uniref:SNF5-domain-containing protein n=1 Tax=Cryoendolithus antarcticus TaxID=1507870 RepID=A0A1V8SJM7_9PEZI|nr:hypothetical protein B0A48_15132 [Cryoendolithus antarcticus]
MAAPGSLQQQPQYNGRWNGTGAGHAGTDNAQSMAYDNAGQQSESAEAIRAGKQRARETMMAAGVGNVSAVASGQQAADGNAVNGLTNGAHTLSRKRSRDGSQLPVQQAVSQSQAADTQADGERQLKDEVLLDRYVQRDLLSVAAHNDQMERMRELAKYKEAEREFYAQDVGVRRRMDPGTIFGTGFAGYGNGVTNGPSRILYSSQRMPPAHRKSGQLRTTRKETSQQAEQHEELVPVRLDLELDKLRLRDTFTWNMHEKLVTPEMFTDHLLEDLKLPPDHLQEVGRQVRAEMVDQILNYYPHVFVDEGPAEQGKLYVEHKDDEMRIQIKLSITIGRITLIDQFEWDINNPQNSPEDFARVMARENALSGEFTTAIAHSIREQTQLYTKSLWLTNHAFDGRPLEDPDLKDSLLPTPLLNTFRPQQMQKDWTPWLYEMTEAELERTETSMMREHRAQKRQLNRRGGPALPDLKDRQRTVRSLIVHSVIPGSVESWETTGIPKTRRSGRGGRRPGARADEDMDSDDLESDGSGAESPAPATLSAPGTTRTRGMRGAASAAQIAMRANYGRSQTPDAQLLGTPQHEPRASARISLLHEGSVMEDETLIVRLKVGKARFKAWLEDYNAKKRASQFPLSGYASQPAPSSASLVPPAAAARGGTPSKNVLGTPAMASKPLPSARDRSQANGRSRGKPAVQYDHLGRVETTNWPSPSDEPPPPPPWLTTGISTLRSRHPDSDFTAFMKAYLLSPDATTQIRPPEPPQPGHSASELGGGIFYLPRIRCNDCPGKVYTTVEESVVEGFEVHLKNRVHRGRVEERKGGRA